MKEPFSHLLSGGERVMAAGEAELGINTGPLASASEILVLFSPVFSIVALVKLSTWPLKTGAALAIPLVLFLLSRYLLRRWHRPRQWVGVTNHRVLFWKAGAAFRYNPRIDTVSVAGMEGVELLQDGWDERHGVHQVILHYQTGAPRNLARIHNAEAVRDALVALVQQEQKAAPPTPTSASAPVTAAAPPPADFRP